jgi:hypothetical protein
MSADIFIQIYNMSGQLVMSKNFENRNLINLNIQEFAAGTYVLRVQHDQKQFSSILLKQ